jgi:hypothetical protein
METSGPASFTDEILQAEARRILYDDDDSWNQTAADNPEWLALFKKAHGIVDVPAGFDRNDALEDLGVMGDITAFDQIMRAETIQEVECNGKGEPTGMEMDLGMDLNLGTVQECFRYPGWGQIAEMECEELDASGGLQAHPQIVDGDVGELQMFNWDEGLDVGLDGAVVFNMGCGA